MAIMLHAPAKVNLHLAVGGRRPDGYHEVTTVLQALELHDEVVIEAAASLEVACSPDLGIAAHTNLAAVAARALAEELGRAPEVRIGLLKRIPAGAGLGGGSSDAAAVLVGLGVLWGLSAADPLLTTIAGRVGADVPFFLGGGTALYAGRGDVPVRRLPTPALAITLVNPRVPVSTAATYAAFDRLLTPAPVTAGPMLEALECGDAEAVASALYDNLTEATVGLAPEVGDALAWVRAADAVRGAAMCGSGSSVFAICDDAASAEAVAEAALSHGWWAAATRTISRGVRVGDEVGEGRA